MDFLTAVQRVQEACSEEQTSSVSGLTAGSLDQKFVNFVTEAYRIANTWKRWPWAVGTTTVTELASPLFTLDTTVLELTLVTYKGFPLNSSLTYDDLIYRFYATGGSAQVADPVYAAMKDFDTLFVYPTPADASPATNIEVRGFGVIADPTADTDVLAGPAQYHDAVVQLAYAIACRKHFGDTALGQVEEKRAYSMLQRVATKARRGNARPRIRT